LSPDATRAVGRDAANAGQGDIWLLDFARGVRTRLTFHQTVGSFPIWSPDGNRIAFSVNGVIYEKASSGAGEEKELFKKPNEFFFPTSWSRDGRFLLFNTNNASGNLSDLWLLPLEGNLPPLKLLETPFSEGQAVFSPDMRWIAYTSTESGRAEVYVRPFVAAGPSGPALGEGKWQISRDGGALSKWRGDGKELFFRNGSSPMAVDVSANGVAFQAGIPTRLFPAPGNTDWDVTADGKRFLIVTSPQTQNTQTPLTVVLNWQADLKR
jgi:Tol biopolymer transport system component